MSVSLPTGTYLSSTPMLDNWDAGTEYTFFLRFKPNWSSGDSVAHNLFQAGSIAAVRYFELFKFSDNNVYMGHFNTATEGRASAADTGIFSSGVWANHMVTFDGVSNVTVYYANNVVKATKTSAAPFPSWNTQVDAVEVISARFSGGSYIFPGDGSYAELGRWNRILTSAERAFLQSGFAPSFIPRGLQEYRPLINKGQSKGLPAQNADIEAGASGQTWVSHPAGFYFPGLISSPDLPNSGGSGGGGDPGGGATDSNSRLISPASWHLVHASVT